MASTEELFIRLILCQSLPHNRGYGGRYAGETKACMSFWRIVDVIYSWETTRCGKGMKGKLNCAIIAYQLSYFRASPFQPLV
jgi:hypothetical protein